MTFMPLLETERLIIRPFEFEDIDVLYRILDVELSAAEIGAGPLLLAARSRWLEWTILNYEQLALLYQPPYGDRAIVTRADGRLLGAVGFVPALGPFAQLPYFQEHLKFPIGRGFTPEVGLYYAVSPQEQRRGYATEAAAVLIRYAFNDLHLTRIIATTMRDNLASIAVMRKLGMTVDTNPFPDPPWFQVVGILENPENRINANLR